jgi:hypothetical protein
MTAVSGILSAAAWGQGERLHLQQELRAGERHHLHRGAGRRMSGVNEFIAHRADLRQVRHVGEIVGELDHLSERQPRCGKAAPQVLKPLASLRRRVAGADELAISVVYAIGKVLTPIWSIAKSADAMLRIASACESVAHI